MSATKPPRSHRSSFSSGGEPSSSDSSKSPRTSLSDSPSTSATNFHGRDVLDERLRSVLCHPMGLPLLYALHDKDPGTLPYLSKQRRACDSQEESRLNAVLKEAVREWEQGTVKNEPQLTKMLIKKIEEQNNAGFNAFNELHVKEEEKPDGRIDIILTGAESKNGRKESTPFAVIEFGLSGIDWWKKLDQGVIYLDRMRKNSQKRPYLRFHKPLLLAVVTYDTPCEGNECECRIGVLLCCRKNIDNENDQYRMSLLWHSQSNTVDDASKMFGRLLRVTSDFRRWRDNNSNSDEVSDAYEYFSSNCCKVVNHNKEMVLRCYDSRVRKTNRSPEIYLNSVCRDIVGDVETIVALPGEDATDAANPKKCHRNDEFWFQSKERGLLIIAVPYRQGSHAATRPKAFLPVISQLEKLHRNGFVHGDIRAFNTVFGDQEDQGYLIDFDFGGKIKSALFPKGYRGALPDGLRLGDGGEEVLARHDWYALTNLIFKVHRLIPPEKKEDDDESLFAESYRLQLFWERLARDPKPEEIKELKEMLRTLDDQGWTAEPTPVFEAELRATGLAVTKRGATGSPPEKIRNAL